MEIIKEILPQIVTDEFLYPMSPPPPLYNDNEEREKYLKSIEILDTTKHYISIEDSTYVIKDEAYLVAHLNEIGYPEIANEIRIMDDKMRLPISITQIKNIDKYELFYRKILFPNGIDYKNFYDNNFKFLFYGNISFSRPFLNNLNNYGWILYKRECGFECNQENIIIIEKQKNEWTIKQIINAR